MITLGTLIGTLPVPREGAIQVTSPKLSLLFLPGQYTPADMMQPLWLTGKTITGKSEHAVPSEN